MIAVRPPWSVSIELDWLALFGLPNVLLLYFPDSDFLAYIPHRISTYTTRPRYRRLDVIIHMYIALSTWCCIPELPLY